MFICHGKLTLRSKFKRTYFIPFESFSPLIPISYLYYQFYKEENESQSQLHPCVCIEKLVNISNGICRITLRENVFNSPSNVVLPLLFIVIPSSITPPPPSFLEPSRKNKKNRTFIREKLLGREEESNDRLTGGVPSVSPRK